MRISTSGKANRNFQNYNTFNPVKTTISPTLSIRYLGFNGTYEHRALPSLHGGALKITFTVPLNTQKRTNVKK